MTSLTSVQTKGLKKHFHEQKYGVKEYKRSENTVTDDGKVTNTLRGVKRTDSDEDSSDEIKKPRDYNVIGLEDSDSEMEDEEVGEQEIPETNIIEESLPEVVENERKAEPEPAHPEVSVETIERKPATYVHVVRDADIQIARLKLPIIVEEQLIMETISENMVTILAGETGR